MLLKNGLIPLIILLISLLIGCADDSVTQTGNTVTVHLTDCNGLENSTYFAQPNISIGNFPIAMTDENGRKSFSNISPPYSITVEGRTGYSLFKNVILQNPEIVVPGYSESFLAQPYGACEFNIDIRLPEDGHVVILHFISKDNFYEYPYNFIVPEAYYQLQREIYVPKNTYAIAGKLIIMYCMGYSYRTSEGNITEIFSFDSLGIKDITLHQGNNDTISFAQQEITKNLHESNVTYSTVLNEEQFTEAYFTFPGYSIGSDIMFHRNSYLNYSLPVPADIPIPFEIKMRNTIGGSLFSIRPQVNSKGALGSSFSLEHKQVQLLEPPEGQTGVNENTVFRFDDNIDEGVYVVAISSSSYIFTDKKYLTFGEMINRGFYLRPNRMYSWSVYKISTFSNINDFLSAPYIQRDNFTRVSASEKRLFRTAE